MAGQSQALEVRDIYFGDAVSFTRDGTLCIKKDHCLGIDKNGLIVHSEPSDSPASQLLLKGGHGHAAQTAGVHRLDRYSFLLPPFVDLHLHAAQFLYLGTGLHLPLFQWLDAYAYRAEERLDANPELARKVYQRLARRCAEAGTGAVLLFGTIKTETNLILAEEFEKAGLRAFVGKLSMDISSRPSYVEPSTAHALSEAERFVHLCREMKSDLIRPVLTPRFVPTCTDELLIGLGYLAERENVMIQSHLAEGKEQSDWVRETRGAEDIDVFERSGLLTDKTVQAHCTYLDEPMLARMADAGSSIGHCPLSNCYHSAAQPLRLREALDGGVKVGMGSDVAGGYRLDILSAMRTAVLVSRLRGKEKEVGWKEVLWAATCGGAEALGMGDGWGSWEKGNVFDAQLVQLVDPVTGLGQGNLDFLDLESGDVPEIEEMLERWWCNGDDRNRAAVWIAGKKVYSRP